jgi:hypothetical protein
MEEEEEEEEKEEEEKEEEEEWQEEAQDKAEAPVCMEAVAQALVQIGERACGEGWSWVWPSASYTR